tara:strand:+ start:485 stop:1471 length:987 start_codon:yes stop_codon:yes gene_type:complete
MEYKQSEISDVKVLDETQGIVEAYTNSMGIIDSDGDVIDPSAFNNSIQNNLPIPALVGHNPSAVVGKVVDAQAIQQPDGSAKLYNKIQFNMDTQAGKDAYSNVAGGYVREWSVGFNIPENGVELDREENKLIRRIKDLDWVEVSSVLRGASPNTGTLSAKSEEEKRALPAHDTGTTDESWDGAVATRNLNEDDESAYLEAFAFVEYGANPDAKSSYKFIHHEVNTDGEVGDANIRACQTGIGVLNGARGGTTIPDVAIKGVYRHLATHLEDADLEPPELKSTEPEQSHSADKDQVAEKEKDERDTIAERLIASRLRQSNKRIAKGLNE